MVSQVHQVQPVPNTRTAATARPRQRARRRRLDPGTIPPGRAITIVRTMFDLDAAAVAKAAGLTGGTLCRLERGQRDSSASEFRSVWEVLGHLAFGSDAAEPGDG